MSWDKGWMNFALVCINGCGVSRGYIADDTELTESCPICHTEMEGFRLLKKEEV